jgi:hypothetical protein
MIVPFPTDLLDMSLGLGVERAVKVGLVSLEVSRATNWMCLVVGVDATSGEDGDVNASFVAAIGQVEGTDDIISDGLLLVILAPIDIWTASRSSCVKDVGGLDSLQLVLNGFSVLHANCRGVDLLACVIGKLPSRFKMAVSADLDFEGEFSSGQQPNLHHPR